MSDPAIWITLAASLLGCYFAACNTVLKTFSRARLTEMLQDRGVEKHAALFIDQRARLLLMTGTVRACLSLVVLLALLNYVERHYGGVEAWAQDLIAFTAAGVLVTVFGIAVPASLARYHREALVARSAGVLQVCLLAFGPVADFLGLLDPVVRRVSGGQPTDTHEADVSDEIISVMQDHQPEGTVDEDQKDMIEAVVEFPATTVDEIMTPRTDVQGIPADADIDKVKELILRYGHSRIPVYDENIDHVLGMLYVKDLIRLIGSDEPFDLKMQLREALMVPESKSVRDLLDEFKTRKVHIAIVLDEYGGTAGLVTIEDIIEEVMGEIRDEYEPAEEPEPIQRADDGAIEVDARVHIDDLNDELDLDLPEDTDYDTVGGFVFSTLGHIPQVGEQFEFQGTRITVTAAERTKVMRVKLETIPETSAPMPHDGAA